ncbi:hypothetical protein [Aurantibacillus circumpalustris]|uniref:hypothetical protein n=1 Tax=Aurantibacillus circumpalustris TaxID=3036359 RepID=UPI00295C128F|nr:hypothetical protein [Aurantibacillus circumpalustris]
MVRLIISLFFIFSLQLSAFHRSMFLQQALDKKLVTATGKALGGHQGFCINLTLKNLTKDSLVILIEAGRRLNSIEDINQDILIVKQELLALKSNELKRINVKGYCCQASMHSPSKGAIYDINKLADSNLVKLARYLNKSKFDLQAEQSAVWAISEKRSAANIASENDSLTQSLREMVAYIKGEELPWYRILSQNYVYQNGAISCIYLKLQGLVSLSTDQENYITLCVRDEKGLNVCLVKSEWLKAGANQIYKLDLPIKGMARGKYSLEITSPDKQLLKREFEI